MSNKAKSAVCCFLFNRDQRSISSFCDFVMVTVVKRSSSLKNWERVILKALQIFSREEMVGSIFFLYQEEIVDCGNPDLSANSYSVQPRSKRFLTIVSRMFCIISPFS